MVRLDAVRKRIFPLEGKEEKEEKEERSIYDKIIHYLPHDLILAIQSHPETRTVPSDQSKSSSFHGASYGVKYLDSNAFNIRTLVA